MKPPSLGIGKTPPGNVGFRTFGNNLLIACRCGADEARNWYEFSRLTG
jgi:hypothetical protein